METRTDLSFPTILSPFFLVEMDLNTPKPNFVLKIYFNVPNFFIFIQLYFVLNYIPYVVINLN